MGRYPLVDCVSVTTMGQHSHMDLYKRVEINTFITIFFAKFAKSLMIISFSLISLFLEKTWEIQKHVLRLAHGFFLTIIPHGYYSLYGESIQYTGV